MLLELLTNPRAIFVTLTYDEQHLPQDKSLRKEDLQQFLKRLRYYFPGREIRYFAVGEYGDESWRAHYHLIIYGVDFVERDVLLKAWTLGLIHVGTAETDSMQYVAGYVTKKMTSSKDLRLKGRKPEFALMSRKPGLGFKAVKNFADAVLSNPGAAASLTAGWIPDSFKVGKDRFPLDRFLKSKLYPLLSITDEAKRRKNYEQHMTKLSEIIVKGSDEYHRQRRAKVVYQEGRLRVERKRSI